MFDWLRRKQESPAVPNDLTIRVFPKSTRTGLLCQAEPYGDEGYRRCPFLRSGRCKLWGWDINQRPDLPPTCPVTEVTIPIPPD